MIPVFFFNLSFFLSKYDDLNKIYHQYYGDHPGNADEYDCAYFNSIGDFDDHHDSTDEYKLLSIMAILMNKMFDLGAYIKCLFTCTHKMFDIGAYKPV